MVKKILENYYHFFDKKLQNWEIVVAIVTLIILSIWFFYWAWNDTRYYKTNLLESNNIKKRTDVEKEMMVEIEWEIYKITFTKM